MQPCLTWILSWFHQELLGGRIGWRIKKQAEKQGHKMHAEHWSYLNACIFSGRHLGFSWSFAGKKNVGIFWSTSRKWSLGMMPDCMQIVHLKVKIRLASVILWCLCPMHVTSSLLYPNFMHQVKQQYDSKPKITYMISYHAISTVVAFKRHWPARQVEFGQ